VRYILLLFGVLIISCSEEPLLDAEYKTLEEGSLRLNERLEKNDLSVLIFLSPECPLCQNYAPTIRDIQNKFSDKNVAFYGIVSGEFYSREDILRYKLKYALDFPILLDPEINLADQLKASITPEVVVLTANAEIIYRGAIDNWAISLGQKRLQASAHYLRDAISNYLDEKRISPTKTDAVGCFIE